MSRIQVKDVARGDRPRFEVTITDDDSESQHEVTATQAALRRLGEGVPPRRVIEASFRFLLDREPKESILQTFDLATISRYFPEFEEELEAYL